MTKEKFTGNPAGVITNADGLSESQMQKIARELNIQKLLLFSITWLKIIKKIMMYISDFLHQLMRFLYVVMLLLLPIMLEQ
ncbi:TPA: PhzF family phenazine biosynthesis protein [Clostridioides difficile]|nr:PhzF family phenazine biosynthesis protein [Clostridioides difficile]HBF4535906.1 PhzF family phenazine biosynthesis protein [Clostridioides difficile]HBF4841195.1 PhzF family phenazine biosynthesis protein [Clostridioides difficile]HBF5069965.1 PhzF family phenazine biosynthesis protein [Clostridioides difficile]HBF5082444.1 PhzF family phenazine biosynthesis protein [Clostridioides difficile]